MIFLEAVLMGVFATYIMDFLAGVLAKRGVIYPFIEPEAIGRWFLYIFKGKFIHKDIRESPALKNEKLWCLMSHYLIGIVLAGCYLVVDAQYLFVSENLWLSIVFGIVTVVFPWFWLLPSTGFGFMAAKSPVRTLILRTNLLNHTNYGLGMFLWLNIFHRFFI